MSDPDDEERRTTAGDPVSATGDPATFAGAGWMTNALATAAIGVLQLGVGISLAALVFAGPLSAGAGRAAAGFVLGTAVVSAIVGYRSSMSVVIAGAQDTAAIVIAAIAASIAGSADIADAERIPTVVVMIALATVTTGAAFWLLGRYGLSSFVRFLPYPVISGFTAGTGWLLVRGGVEVMHRETLTLGGLTDLLSWDEAKFLLPGLALAVVMTAVLTTRVTNTLVSVAILGGALLFHLIARRRTSLDALEEEGWLIGPFDDAHGWAPVRPSDLQAADWSALADRALPIAAVVIVSVIGVLLNLSGLETGPDRDIDMNGELRSSGTANVLAGLGGGLVGYHLIGDTLLGRQLGARGRVVPISIAVVAAGTFLVGTDLIALVPRSVAGGVLTGLGLTMLVDWARKSLAQMNRIDDLLSGLILGTIALLGVLPGVTVGVVVAAAVFVVKYGRINPVRHTIDAAGRSNVDRHTRERDLLERATGSTLAFELQGYLFFGSTTQLRSEIDRTVSNAGGTGTCRFVIIDFAHVTGVDSTASVGLSAMARQLHELDMTTIWSGLKPEVAADIEVAVEQTGADLPPMHRDLDHAIAWCEEELVTAAEATAGDPGDPSAEDDRVDLELAEVMHVRSLEPGEVLIAAGAADRDLYFVESGRLSAWITTDDGREARIRQVMPGAALGEITFCTGGRRTATVIADSHVVVRVLTRQRFDRLVAEQPQLAIRIQEDLLRRMGHRVSSTSAMVRDLLR